MDVTFIEDIEDWVRVVSGVGSLDIMAWIVFSGQQSFDTDLCIVSTFTLENIIGVLLEIISTSRCTG